MMHNALPTEEERRRAKKRLEEEALILARESKWEDAAQKNREVLELYPKDISAMNRLGKALLEQGRYKDAHKVYSQALELDPMNTIAQKNVERLANVEEKDHAAKPAERIDPRLFIGETGKTGYTALVSLGGAAVLARTAVGDQVYLHPEGRILYMQNSAGENLGRVEPRLANRLIKAMSGGNEYAAAITDISSHEVLVIIRESFQSPSMIGRVVFTPEDAEVKRADRSESGEDTEDEGDGYDDGDDEGEEDEDSDGDASESDDGEE